MDSVEKLKLYKKLVVYIFNGVENIIRPTADNEDAKIPTFSEVCKRDGFRIKSANEQELLTDMTRCQGSQTYHAQTTMADR